MSGLLSSVFGEVYSGEAHDPLAYPSCTLSVAVDKDADIISVYYHSENYIITVFPAPYCAFCACWHIWDEIGFDKRSPEYEGVPCSDCFNVAYSNEGTWVRVKMRWCFTWGGTVWYLASAQVDIYVPASGGLGGSPHDNTPRGKEIEI
jgi:hypothetical protein